MIDLVMLCQNRPRLVNQAIQSLVKNTTEPWRLTIVDDGSGIITAKMVESWARVEEERVQSIRLEPAQGPGPARNIGIKESEEKWGRGDLLYLCDSDCFFLPKWDQVLLHAWSRAEEFKFKVLGLYCHPYNQTNAKVVLEGGLELHEKYAIGLLSWGMRWETHDQFGLFEPAPQANFSEDHAYCHRVRLAGFRVGCVFPWMVINTGMTGSSGKLSPGSEYIYNQNIPEGVIIE